MTQHAAAAFLSAHFTAVVISMVTSVIGGCVASVEHTERVRHGERLVADKGCIACHSIDGTSRVGPSFKSDFGTTAALADGSQVIVDAPYLRESILHPQARARPGYPPAMPSYDGRLDPREVDALIAYLESLR